MEAKLPHKPKNFTESLNCAIEGIIHAFKTQKHIRYHYIIAMVVLGLSLVLKMPLTEFILFVFAVVILLSAEMFNTAIEEAVDLIEQKHNLKAKATKDVSAGAVLVASTGVVLMGYVVFMRYIYSPAEGALRAAEEFAPHLAVISLLGVLIGVVAIKAYGGRGRPLWGGIISGHTALAFSLWMSVTLMTLNPLVSLLTLFMAVLVWHGRLKSGVHTTGELIMGALTGVGITLAIYSVYSLIR